jgi:NDP-sugar pyrophosphorylase family protein
MNKPTLVILAAGMASRYGSMKQVQGFGPAGETIMDYSIYDALRAGFGKIVFIIRKEFASDFEPVFNKKLEGRAEVAYVYQELNEYAEGFEISKERTKPWGTAHAVLSASKVVDKRFAVINADDFYGRDAFEKAADFLGSGYGPDLAAIIGYNLINTLSEFGSVSRGVCEVDEMGFLKGINERTNIYSDNGRIVYEENGAKHELSPQTIVSMNFWCFHHVLFDFFRKIFEEFLAKNAGNPKAEFFIPIVADEYIRSGKGRIKVISTSAPWFGVTYKEDAPSVEKNLQQLITRNEYPANLWNVAPNRKS